MGGNIGPMGAICICMGGPIVAMFPIGVMGDIGGTGAYMYKIIRIILILFIYSYIELPTRLN